MTAIIFSRNRAMQLDLLLRSIYKYASILTDIRVLVKADDNSYLTAYKTLRLEHPKVSFFPQREDFKYNFLSLIPHDGHTMLLCDDDVFFRPCVVPSPLITCYSTRLGNNITYCYTLNRPGTDDFHWLFSLDGNVYRSYSLLVELMKLSFSDPSSLEVAGQSIGGTLGYGDHSCLVGICHNQVQMIIRNRNMGGSAAVLNDLYLQGKRIKLEKMDFSNVIGVHQDIPYVIE